VGVGEVDVVASVVVMVVAGEEVVGVAAEPPGVAQPVAKVATTATVARARAARRGGYGGIRSPGWVTPSDVGSGLGHGGVSALDIDVRRSPVGASSPGR
jgi:hypothetical protein